MTTCRSIILAAILVVSALGAVSNRLKACQKAVNLGVTFYTAAELVPILTCAEGTWYSNPNDTTAIISKAKSCVISNSLDKTLSAMSLYSGFNGCTDLTTLLDSMTTPFINQCKPVINKALKVVNNCKKNNPKTGTAKQNACMNKVYGQCLAMVTRQFVNKVCTFLAKKMTVTQFNCCKTYAVKIANVTSYGCYKLQRS